MAVCVRVCVADNVGRCGCMFGTAFESIVWHARVLIDFGALDVNRKTGQPLTATLASFSALIPCDLIFGQNTKVIALYSSFPI